MPVATSRLPMRFDIVLKLPVSDHLHLLLYLGCGFAAEFNILLFGEQVPARLELFGPSREGSKPREPEKAA